MATAYNTEVRVYKNVPLIKGGVEVLFTFGNAQGLGVLNQFLYKTYTEYYYQREVRNAIQIDDTMDNLEGVNYIAWRNQSHENMWYYAFVDSLQYVNDNNTQINFTIDPFPTFLHETSLRDYVYVKRNSPRQADKSSTTLNYRPDYLPESARIRYAQLATSSQNITCDRSVFFFTATDSVILDITTQLITVGTVFDMTGKTTGLWYGYLEKEMVEKIKEKGGDIIGAYAIPAMLADNLSSFWNMHIFKNLTSDLHAITTANNFYSIFPSSGSSIIMNLRNGKIKTGAYHKLILQSSFITKNYNIEDFADPSDMTFEAIGAIMPEPSIIIYPKNYQGFEHNVAAGIVIKMPSLPLLSKQVYTQAEKISDFGRSIMAFGSGAMAGALMGNVGTVAGASMGLISSLSSMLVKSLSRPFEPPSQDSLADASCVTFDGQGNPIVPLKLTIASPSEMDYAAIDNYLDYYGWSWEQVMDKDDINDTNGAYLQIGSEYCSGSEADVEINTRMMQGIKIRTAFT